MNTAIVESYILTSTYPKPDTLCLRVCLGSVGSRIKVSELINEIKAYKINQVHLCGDVDPLSKTYICFTREFLLNRPPEMKIFIETEYVKSIIKKKQVQGFEFLKCGRFGVGKIEDYSNKEGFSLVMVMSSNQCLYDENYKLLSKKGIYLVK